MSSMLAAVVGALVVVVGLDGRRRRRRRRRREGMGGRRRTGGDHQRNAGARGFVGVCLIIVVGIVYVRLCMCACVFTIPHLKCAGVKTVSKIACLVHWFAGDVFKARAGIITVAHCLLLRQCVCVCM